MFIDTLLKEWREESAKSPAGNLQETKKAITKAVFNKVIDGLPAKTLKDARAKVRAKRSVNGKENPGDKYRSHNGNYNVWGATGIDGDGYALEDDGNPSAEAAAGVSMSMSESNCYQEGGLVKKPCKKCKKKECCCEAENMNEWMSRNGLL